MAQATYLTFDLGTTGLKTALVGDDGRVPAVHTVEYTPQAPRPGWLEMRDLIDDLVPARNSK